MANWGDREPNAPPLLPRRIQVVGSEDWRDLSAAFAGFLLTLLFIVGVVAGYLAVRGLMK